MALAGADVILYGYASAVEQEDLLGDTTALAVHGKAGALNLSLFLKC